ncbi:MAG TPA: GTP cyclohydrolase II [Methylomirabilota bacterium]|nr:GTP cyclohydrolase II [Methylomirabilota bacterium]
MPKRSSRGSTGRSGARSERTAQASAQAAVRVVAEARLPTRFGPFVIIALEGASPAETAVALRHGRLDRKDVPLVRIHSQCLTGDVFGSQRCDCRAQLEFSLRKIARARSGLLLYLPQEGRGIGLMNKVRAYELQDQGMDTVEANEELGFLADLRDYAFSAAALKRLGVRRVRLLSNNPDKVQQLEEAGIEVVERLPCQPPASRASRGYLAAKKSKLGHLLTGL